MGISIKMKFDFDRHGREYESGLDRALKFSGKGTSFFAEIRAAYILGLCKKYLGNPAEKKVLDVGCGIGLIERQVATEFGSFHGVDISEQSVRIAQAANPRCSFTVYNGESLPFPDNSFDLVFSSCVLEYLTQPKLSEFFREMIRVLNVGGMMVVIQHNPFNPLTLLVLHRCEYDSVSNQYRKGRLEKMIRKTGMKIEKSEYILFFPFIGKWFRKLEVRLGWLPLGAQYAIAAVKQTS